MILWSHPESKESLCIQSAHLFFFFFPPFCSRLLVSGVDCDVEKLPHALVCQSLSHGKCIDSCGYYSIQSGPATVGLFPVSKSEGVSSLRWLRW